MNVSKGEVAKKEIIKKCFGDLNEEEVIKMILEKGDLQEGGKERDTKLENRMKDIATFVAKKTVNPKTNLPYTINIIEKAIKEIHYSCNLKKAAKKEALEVIKLLESHIPIQRAKIRVKINCSSKDGITIMNNIKSLVTIEKENWDESFDCVSEEKKNKIRFEI